MFHFQSRNLTRKDGKDICRIARDERERDWEEIEEQPHTKFSCALESRQCEYVKNGHRCRLRTKRALPYCWQHAQIVDHVIIKQSTIKAAGMGLFACDRNKDKGEVVFRKGDRITMYARKAHGNQPAVGEFMKDKDMADRYGECVTAPYGVDAPRKGIAVDTACQRSIGSYANTSKTAASANAEMQWTKRDTELALIAKKPIRNGEEIFWYYGKTYQFDYPEFFDYRVRHTGRKNTNAKCRRNASKKSPDRRRSSTRQRRHR